MAEGRERGERKELRTQLLGRRKKVQKRGGKEKKRVLENGIASILFIHASKEDAKKRERRRRRRRNLGCRQAKMCQDEEQDF